MFCTFCILNYVTWKVCFWNKNFCQKIQINVCKFFDKKKNNLKNNLRKLNLYYYYKQFNVYIYLLFYIFCNLKKINGNKFTIMQKIGMLIISHVSFLFLLFKRKFLRMSTEYTRCENFESFAYAKIIDWINNERCFLLAIRKRKFCY